MTSFTICIGLNLDTFSKKTSQNPHRKPLGTNFPLPCFAFLPTSWETYSGGELPLESLNEKAPVFWPFSSGTLCPIFKVQFVTLALCLWLPFLPWEVQCCIKSCEESWPLCHGPPQAGGRGENPHTPRARKGFIFCLCVWLLYGFKP